MWMEAHAKPPCPWLTRHHSLTGFHRRTARQAASDSTQMSEPVLANEVLLRWRTFDPVNIPSAVNGDEGY
jgi:hypothetical protein